MKYHEVTLTKWERYYLAPIWAHRRWMEAIEHNRTDQHGLTPEDDGLAKHYWGLCGEMAYAKAVNTYFHPTCNTFHAPDVGKIHIRTRTHHFRELIVREDDPNGFFVLVTVELSRPSEFRVWGGILADEARQHPEWFQNHGDREPAWFVPQPALTEFGDCRGTLSPATSKWKTSADF